MNKRDHFYRMCFKGVALIVLYLFSNNIYSQDGQTAKNTIYSEFLGNTASSISLNYDRIILKKERIALSISVGVGTVPSNIIKFNNVPRNNYLIYGIPVSANLLFGKKNNHIEIGVGATFQQGLYAAGAEYSRTLFGVILLGYRYQKEAGGFFWKVGFTPFIPIKEYGELTIDESAPKINGLPIVPLVGIAFGYTFIKKTK